MATRTYYTGLNALVKRQTNLSGPWDDISVSLNPIIVPGGFITYSGNLHDVMTDPLIPEKVFVVGQVAISPVDPAFPATGIFYSVDAGQTWLLPLIDEQPGFEYVEVWVIDSNNIVAVGTGGLVSKSIDGGATFNKTASYATPTGLIDVTGSARCTHWVNPSIGVVGFNNRLLKTIDGGVTWSVLNGGNPFASGNLLGVFISADEQTIVACGQSIIVRSVDGGANFTTVHTWTQNEGLHLTWNGESNFWATGQGQAFIRSTDGGATWTVIWTTAVPPNSGPIGLAAHFYNPLDGFFSWNDTLFVTADGGFNSFSVDFNFDTYITAVWTQLQICYLLTSCDEDQSPVPILVTSTDLSQYLGQVVKIQGDDTTCWTVSLSPSCTGSVPVIISESFDNCQDCFPQCYLLTDCKEKEDPIKISTDIGAYVGKVIQFEGSETCWIVSESPDCICAIPLPGEPFIFDDCDSCPPTPVPQVTKPFIEPGFDPKNCDPEKVIEANTNFADVYYRKVLSLRYGINSCCEEDLDRAFIRKSLVDLEALWDPGLCCPDTSPSDPCAI